MKIVKNKRYMGDPVEGFDVEFARKVYEGCSGFHHLDFEIWFIKYYSLICVQNRWEYIVYDDNGDTLASMCFYIDPEEIHKQVPVVSVLCAFSADPDQKALFGGHRWMLEIAKEEEIDWVMFSKSSWPKGVFVNYKQVSKGVKNARE